MAKLEIKATIEISDEKIIDFNDKEQFEWFIDLINDKENTHLLLWSNDIGDEIGSTNNFSYKLIIDGK